MEKKKEIRNILKYIFLSLSVFTYGFIVYQSAIKYDKSKSWNNWVNDIWTDLLNNKLNMKEKVEVVKPESIAVNFGDNDFAYDLGNTYEALEIPLGCEKNFIATISPEATTNKTISFIASPSENINIVQNGNLLTVEGLKEGKTKISVISNADSNIKSDFEVNVTPKKSPNEFMCKQSYGLNKGESAFLSVILNETNDLSELKKMEFFDLSKLSAYSSDSSIVEIRGNYVKAVNTGTTSITVFNEDYSCSKDINIYVSDNSNPIINAGTFDVSADRDYVNVGDYKNEVYTQLSVNWSGGIVPTDQNITWTVSDPLKAIVTHDGKVYGYKNFDMSDSTFTVRATSVDNPSIYKDIELKLSQVVPTSISLKCPKSLIDNDGYCCINTGKAVDIDVVFGPTRTTNTGYSIAINTPDIISAKSSGNVVNIIGLKDGCASLKVISTADENVVSQEIKIKVETRGFINEDNKDDFSHDVRKYFSGHAFLFGLEGIFLMLYVFYSHYDKPKKFKIIALCATLMAGFMLGGISEVIQIFVPGRSASFSDVLIDLMGFLIGAVIIFLTTCLPTIISDNKVIKKEKSELNNVQ